MQDNTLIYRLSEQVCCYLICKNNQQVREGGVAVGRLDPYCTENLILVKYHFALSILPESGCSLQFGFCFEDTVIVFIIVTFYGFLDELGTVSVYSCESMWSVSGFFSVVS